MREGERRTGSERRRRRKRTLREVEKAEKFFILPFQPQKLLNHQQLQTGWIMNLSLQRSAGWNCRGVQPYSHLALKKQRRKAAVGSATIIKPLFQSKWHFASLSFHDCKDYTVRSEADKQSGCFYIRVQVSVIHERQTEEAAGRYSASSRGDKEGTRTYVRARAESAEHTTR